MSNKKGIRVGKYRLMPLGIAIIAILLVAILAIGALYIFDIIGPKKDVTSPGPDTVIPIQTPTTPVETPEPIETTDNVLTASPEPTVEITVEPTETPEPEPELRSATIRSLGEIALQPNLLASAQTETSYDFVPMLEYVKDILGDADYTVADIEGPMGGKGSGYSGSGLMNSPPQIMLALLDAGVDMVTLANDHALDTNFEGLLNTITNCINCGMDYVGAASTLEEKNIPKIVELNGINVGFLNYTSSLNGLEKRTEAAATDYGVNLMTKRDCAADVKTAKEGGADVIVAYVSWGEMMERTPNKTQQAIAKVMVDAGVDVIIGCNPHTVQPAFWLEGKKADGTPQKTLCLCATGNFLSDVRNQYGDSGIIFEFTIQETEEGTFEIVEPKYIPTYVWRYANETGTAFEYRVLSAGEWLNELPAGMSDEDGKRVAAVWAEIQNVMGTSVATVASE